MRDVIEDWWTTEAHVRETMRAKEEEIARLTELGFVIFSEALKQLESRKLEPWEVVAAFAAVQFHNTLRTARELAFAGYGVQSLALARLAHEFMVLLWWIPNHRDQAPAWLDAMASRKTAGAMAQEVFSTDTETGARHRTLRESLHRFAHQDALAFTAIYKPGPEGIGIQIGPNPDHGQLRGASVYLLTWLALGTDTLVRISNTPPEALVERSNTYLGNVHEWRERTDREEHARLIGQGVVLPPFDEL